MRTSGLDREPPLMVCLPYWTEDLAFTNFVVRTAVPPDRTFGQIRAALASVDGDLPPGEAHSMDQIVVESVSLRRFQTSVAAVFALGARANDPATILVAAWILILVSAAACALPAWRAVGVDPMTALRSE